MRITLRQGGILVSQQFLHMGERNSVGYGNAGKGMSEAVQGAEVVRKAGRFLYGIDLLMNIGPQPDGRLPLTALDRLQGIGRWLAKYGDSIYGTTAGDVPEQNWGCTTRKGDRLFVHILDPEVTEVFIPLEPKVKVKSAVCLADGSKVVSDRCRQGVHISAPKACEGEPDRVVELKLQ